MTTQPRKRYPGEFDLELIKKYFDPKYIIDIGANVGIFNGWCKDVFPNAEILSIEANPYCAPDLEEKNIKFIIALLGKERKSNCDFYTNKDDVCACGASTYRELSYHFSDENLKMLKLEQISLDDLNLSLPEDTLIKIDTQGSELDILDGGKKTCENVKGILLEVSVEQFNMGSPLYDEVIEYMDKYGFIPVENLKEHKWTWTADFFSNPCEEKIVQKDILFFNKKFLFETNIHEPKKNILCFYIGYMNNDPVSYSGSEILLVNLSEKFTEIYNVYIFGLAIFNETIKNGVQYLNSNKFNDFQLNNQIDVLIISRYIHFFIEFKLTAKKTFVWSHDNLLISWWDFKALPLYGKWLLKNMENKIDGFITLSEWHKNYFTNFYETDPNKVYIINNFINLNSFKRNFKKQKNKFIWTSAPDRGLNKLIEYFHDIRKLIPDAELYIYQDKNIIDEKIIEQECEYIHFCGRKDNVEILEEFESSEMWFYPTNFEESYCLSALEAQMAKCVCVASDLAALHESVGDRGVLLKEEIYSEKYKEEAINQIVNILNNEELKKEYQEKGYEWALKQNLDERAKQWYKLFEVDSMLKKQQKYE